MKKKLILTRGIQGSGITIKQIGLAEFHLFDLLPTCDKAIGEIMEKYNILVIFEDCEPIVQMYRDMGLTVLQPNKGL